MFFSVSWLSISLYVLLALIFYAFLISLTVGRNKIYTCGLMFFFVMILIPIMIKAEMGIGIFLWLYGALLLWTIIYTIAFVFAGYVELFRRIIYFADVICCNWGKDLEFSREEI